MKETEDRFWRIFNCEKELDTVRISGLEIGGVCASINRDVYYNRINLDLKNRLLVFIKFIFNDIGFVKRYDLNNICFIKTADRETLNKLIDPIYNKYESQGVLIVGGNLIEEGKLKKLNNSLFTLIFSLFSILLKINRIVSTYRKYRFNVSRTYILFQIIPLLTIAITWRNYFNKNSVKLLIVDHDRQKYNAPIIVAAKALGIETLTLMHGVINPPFGYTPIIANEVLVWGELQLNQLVQLGCKKETIKIVGNPIIEKKVTKTIKFINNIGIAINPVGNLINERIWNEKILALSKEFPSKKIFIKLHPSMKKDDSLLKFRVNNVFILDSTEIDNFTFFENIDLLLVSNSSIGYEAVLNDVLVLVNKESDESLGNDDVMISEGAFCDVSKTSDLIKIIKSLDSSEILIKEKIQLEKDFTERYVYQSVGESSVLNITNIIEGKINKQHNYAN